MKTATFSPTIPPPPQALPRRTSPLVLLSRARFWTMSTLLHVVLVCLVGSVVLLKQPTPELGDLVGDLSEISSPQPVVSPPITSIGPPIPSILPVAPLPAVSSLIPALRTNSVVTPTFEVGRDIAVFPSRLNDARPIRPPVGSEPGKLSKELATGIASFTDGWAKGGTATHQKPIRSREFEFTAYLAKYQGGDWDSTVRLEDGQIWAGSLPNLLFIISKLSKKKINATPQVIPLDLASSEIFEKKPPFIWFTGHRDFKLTDQEAANLGEYLRRGGCIWGDSSLPGTRSRFDIAFRREMLRLVPDPNQPWQALPDDHAIFRKAYYSEVKGVAPGMNFYDKPIQALEGYGGEIAVLYTSNDYGDMWQFGLDEKGEIDLSRDEKRRMVACNEDMWHRRNLYFRNIEPKALSDTYKFGTNVIIHLLTRWEDKVRSVPRL